MKAATGGFKLLACGYCVQGVVYFLGVAAVHKAFCTAAVPNKGLQLLQWSLVGAVPERAFPTGEGILRPAIAPGGY
jgi:hypothetical protein